MTLHQRDIFNIPVPRAGLEYGNPILEWIQAAHWANYRYKDFERLPVKQQNLLIAAFRTEQQINAVLAYQNRPKRKRPKGK